LILKEHTVLNKINFVKIGGYILLIGTVCIVILIGIQYDIQQNHVEESPWYVLPLGLFALFSYVIGFVLITKLLKKIGKKLKF